MWLVGTGFAGTISTTDAWLREPPPESKVAAVYLNLTNSGKKTIRLTGVHSAWAEKCEIHETMTHGSHTMMHHKTAIKLAPGSRTELKPGGLHIMLINPKRKLNPGQKVPLSLDFEDHQQLKVTAIVIKTGESFKPGKSAQ